MHRWTPSIDSLPQMTVPAVNGPRGGVRNSVRSPIRWYLSHRSCLLCLHWQRTKLSSQSGYWTQGRQDRNRIYKIKSPSWQDHVSCSNHLQPTLKPVRATNIQPLTTECPLLSGKGSPYPYACPRLLSKTQWGPSWGNDSEPHCLFECVMCRVEHRAECGSKCCVSRGMGQRLSRHVLIPPISQNSLVARKPPSTVLVSSHLSTGPQ